MTTLFIDYKAGQKTHDEAYIIDRTFHKTMDDLMILMDECMNDNVYMIQLNVDGKEICRKYNER